MPSTYTRQWKLRCRCKQRQAHSPTLAQLRGPAPLLECDQAAANSRQLRIFNGSVNSINVSDIYLRPVLLQILKITNLCWNR